MDTTASGAQLQPDDAAQIRATIAPWIQACLDRDWDALLEMCTVDILMSGPGEPGVTGDALRSWLEDYPIMKAMDFDFDRIEVSGNLAVTHGSASMTVEVDGQDAPGEFDFIDVLRKGPDNKWRYSLINFNTNSAPA